jgi:hypothetical protein
MTDHARELAGAFSLGDPARTDIPFMIERAANAAWPTDKDVAIDALRQAKILLPSISTIERAGIAGRAQARKQAAHALKPNHLTRDILSEALSPLLNLISGNHTRRYLA